MAKHANIIPSKQLNVALPLPLYLKLSAHLYSDLECRVPHGAYSRCLIDLLQMHFAERSLDLAPFTGSEPGMLQVTGTVEAIEALTRKLSE